MMKTRYLTALVGIAVLALPAAVPARQPADVRLGQVVAAVAVPAEGFAMLLADPSRTDLLSIQLPGGYTTFEWIDQDPFAL